MGERCLEGRVVVVTLPIPAWRQATVAHRDVKPANRQAPPDSSSLPPDWSAWLASVMPYLRAGDRLPVPRDLAHPRTVGFARPRLAEPRGQVADWVLSVDDGSRLHAHEYGNGVIVMHRDAIDPARGPAAAVWHFVREARAGKVVLGVAAVVGAVLAR